VNVKVGLGMRDAAVPACPGWCQNTPPVGSTLCFPAIPVGIKLFCQKILAPVGRAYPTVPVGLLKVCVEAHFLKSKGGSGFWPGLHQRSIRPNEMLFRNMGRSIQFE